MGLTNYGNGVSTRATSAANTLAGDGDLNCLDLFVDGTATITGGQTFTGAAVFSSTVTVGSGTQLIGQTYYIPVTFGTASALEQLAVIPGFTNCSLDNVYHTNAATSALVASYTVQVGSAGAVAVATVAAATRSVGVIQSLTTTAVTFDGTASALVCIRSVQGTAGATVLTLAVRRSA